MKKITLILLSLLVLVPTVVKFADPDANASAAEQTTEYEEIVFADAQADTLGGSTGGAPCGTIRFEASDDDVAMPAEK